MKAIRLTSIDRPVEEQEIPVPPLGEHDVRVRIRAAGICHSDAHYRSGTSDMIRMPITLGHEIAGEVEEAGAQTNGIRPGDRVCLHYLVSCGVCEPCMNGMDAYCSQGSMLGHHIDGGLATHIVVPERNVIPIPDNVPFEHAAVMMCSSSTAMHAIHRSRFTPGETVAVFGAGGLGMSAIQIARAMGSSHVFAVDVQQEKLGRAGQLGAIPIHGSNGDASEEIKRQTDGRGIDVSLEFTGLPDVTLQAVRSLGIRGRCVAVGLAKASAPIHTYLDMIGKERELIGANDHTVAEIRLVLDLASRGAIDLSGIVERTIPLDAQIVNETLDALAAYEAPVRTVVVP